MAAKTISINSLLLDLENPRITKAGTQREALQRILDDQEMRLAVLAESIVAQGGLNPMDRLLVIKAEAGNKFVVYEGNRRFAAIKILQNPSVLGDLEVSSALRKRLEAAAQKFDPDLLSKVDCFEIKSRAEGAKWLHQRHTGENNGSGIVRWSGIATARFRGNDPALQALDAVLKFGDMDPNHIAEMEESFPITNLDRLLSTPDVRKLIGFDVKQSKLLTDLPPKVAIDVLKKIVMDLSTGQVNVTGLKLKTQQVSYIKNLGPSLPDLSKQTGIWVAVEEWDETTFSSPTVGASTPKGGGKPVSAASNPSPTKAPKAPKAKPRLNLITKDCILSVSNPKIAEIEQELRTLRLADHKHAISVLFRVFLEISIDVYLGNKGVALVVVDKGGHKKDKNLSAKVQDAITAMVADGVPQKNLLGVSNGIHDQHSAIYINTLHNYVHNAFYTPKEGDLTAAFDNARPFIEEIWK